MKTFKLIIEYDGAGFNGWQLQVNAKRTVQGEIEAVLSRIFKKPRVVLTGSGRTDAGVHARGQVAHFRASTDMPPEEIRRALNHNLPPDIVIHEVTLAPERFHAQHSAIAKTYSYTVLNRSYPSAIERGRTYFFPRPLNVRRMMEAAALLKGNHDFTAFANVDPSRTCDAIRTLTRLDIVRRNGGLVVFTIESDGFLYKMVRNLVGTLLDVGVGRLPPEGVKNILASRDRRAAGKAIAPHGLCLERVDYGFTTENQKDKKRP